MWRGSGVGSRRVGLEGKGVSGRRHGLRTWVESALCHTLQGQPGHRVLSEELDGGHEERGGEGLAVEESVALA